MRRIIFKDIAAGACTIKKVQRFGMTAFYFKQKHLHSLLIVIDNNNMSELNKVYPLWGYCKYCPHSFSVCFFQLVIFILSDRVNSVSPLYNKTPPELAVILFH